MTTDLKQRAAECAEFLTAVWGLADMSLYGVVVIRESLDPDSRWHTFSYRWPKGHAAAVRRILDASENHDVYVCPALFRKPNDRTLENVAGSYVLWADHDGDAPTSFGGPVPEPTIRIQSSAPGHVHDYWALGEFLTDIETLETANRSIASYFSADPSGWDAPQLLRPPGTISHKRGGLPVRILSRAQ